MWPLATFKKSIVGRKVVPAPAYEGSKGVFVFCWNMSAVLTAGNDLVRSDSSDLIISLLSFRLRSTTVYPAKKHIPI